MVSGSSGQFSIEEFGGRSTIGFDNTEALRRALQHAAPSRSRITLGPGVYEIDSFSLIRSGAIIRPGGVRLIGAGSNLTTLRVVGSGAINQLFRVNGESEVITSDIRFVGNGIKDEKAPYAGALMYALLSDDADREMNDIFFEKCQIDNFASAAWVFFENHSRYRSIRRCGSRDCNWRSRPGTSPAAGKITVPGHFMYFHGYHGPIEDITVDDDIMEAAHLKGGVGIVGDIRGGYIHIKALLNPGQALKPVISGPDGPGAYALLIYQKPSGAPHNLTVTVDRLENPFSVGIYSAGAYSSRFHVGHAFGQRDTRDATLFKGILAIMSGHDIDARIDKVEDSNRVLMVSIDGGQNLGPAAADVNIDVQLGDVQSRPGARDITIDAGGSPYAGGVRVSGIRRGPAAVGVHLRAGPETVLEDIDLSGLTNIGAEIPMEIGPGRVNLDQVLLPH